MKLKFDEQEFLRVVEVKEGRKYKMYLLDGIPHIAIGHNIIGRSLAQETLDFLGIEEAQDLMTATLNDAQCDFLLKKDFDIAVNDAVNAIGVEAFDAMDATRQHVAVDMSFNLGSTRFRGFKKMIGAIQDRNYDEASVQILDSDAARNPLTEERYKELADQMKSGDVETTKDPVAEISDNIRIAELQKYTEKELISELYARHVKEL